MFIKKIIREGNDSIDKMVVDVIVSDNHFECIALYDLPKLQEGNILDSPLIPLSVNNIQISDEKVGFYKLNAYYSYIIVGILHIKENNIVSVGDILININNFYVPNDINDGQKIEFQVDRLDIQERI